MNIDYLLHLYYQKMKNKEWIKQNLNTIMIFLKHEFLNKMLFFLFIVMSLPLMSQVEFSEKELRDYYNENSTKLDKIEGFWECQSEYTKEKYIVAIIKEQENVFVVYVNICDGCFEDSRYYYDELFFKEYGGSCTPTKFIKKNLIYDAISGPSGEFEGVHGVIKIPESNTFICDIDEEIMTKKTSFKKLFPL